MAAEAGVELLGRRVIPAGVVDSIIQPGRVAGEEGLAEGGQLSAIARRFGDEGASFVDALVEVVVDRSRLDEGDARGHLGWGSLFGVSEDGADAELFAVAIGGVGDDCGDG